MARARDLGVEIGRLPPGAANAITDVDGVRVGHTTLIEGDAIRTGVTVVVPPPQPFFAGAHRINGNGELTGLEWVRDSGRLTTPVALTNTHSVGVVRDALVAAAQQGEGGDRWSLPVVAETWDGFLNDINGFHVKKEHVFEALDGARPGPVAEGNVGGGTGMVAHGFKGGTGTSSRVLTAAQGGYTVGVLVQANYGRRDLLRIAGAPVGQEINDLRPEPGRADNGQGSIIVVVATDAPLLPHQLKRIARRVSLGVGVMGGRGENSSGDIFIAFSTANPEASKSEGTAQLTMLPNERLDPFFSATAEATEEAIVNAMVAARTMRGAGGNTVHALPHERLREVLRKYNRLVK